MSIPQNIALREDLGWELREDFSFALRETGEPSPLLDETNPYLELITPYHRGKPRFSAVVEELTNRMIAARNLALSIPDKFDLNKAIGKQLDIDGEWIGRSRNIEIPILDIYFALDDPNRGLDKGVWKGPYDTASGISRLDDETYRLLLHAKIAANQWDGTAEDAKRALDIFFVDAASKLFIDDHGDGSVVFGVSGKIPNLLYLMLFGKGYIPLKSGGIKTYHLVTSVDNTPMFGLDVDNDYIGGLDKGSWGVTPDWIANNVI